ncbi:MAG: ZIP family metal transporter [Bacteroidaceae bacterium]|nr:ZIP family metal transporter [Bacteroidaceae bacterium]
MTTTLVIGLLVPLLGTVVGSAFVFTLKRDLSPLVQKTLLGFASGVMVAASVWSLLIPSLEMGAGQKGGGLVATLVGFLVGVAFLLLLDRLTPHLHLGAQHHEGPRSRLSRTTMLALAVTLHNLPEGMAVGVVLAGAAQGNAGISTAGALAMAIGIALQNVPEGAIISMPLRAEGNSRLRAFAIGSLSGVVEPIGGLAVVLLASVLLPLMPYLLAFAAGAMLYVVVEELIPEASQGDHSNLGTVGFAVGFALMMALDVLLG